MTRDANLAISFARRMALQLAKIDGETWTSDHTVGCYAAYIRRAGARPLVIFVDVDTHTKKAHLSGSWNHLKSLKGETFYDRDTTKIRIDTNREDRAAALDISRRLLPTLEVNYDRAIEYKTTRDAYASATSGTLAKLCGIVGKSCETSRESVWVAGNVFQVQGDHVYVSHLSLSAASALKVARILQDEANEEKAREEGKAA